MNYEYSEATKAHIREQMTAGALESEAGSVAHHVTADFPERIRLGYVPLEDEARDELITVVETLPLSSEERGRLYEYCTALEMGVANSTKIAMRAARGGAA